MLPFGAIAPLAQQFRPPSIAEFEREQITLRMTRGRRLKVKAGGVLTAGRPPYGYAVIPGPNQRSTLEICESEARIVSLIFTWFTEGDGNGEPLGMYDIVRKLTAVGVPTPADSNPQKGGSVRKRGRGEWNKAAVYRILRNETYTGNWRYGKRNGRTKKDNPPEHCITVSVPPIISPYVWKVAQDWIQLNRHNIGRKSKYAYLLRARVTCGACGSSMACHRIESRGKSYLYYDCGASRDKLHYSHSCSAKAFRAGEVDAVVWGWVKQYLSDPGLLSESLTAVQTEAERESTPIRDRIMVIDNLLADHQRQLKRLLDLYLAGEFEREVLTDRKN